MSGDEWRLRGIDFAMQAEELESPDQLKWLSQAGASFEKAADIDLLVRSRVQHGAAALRWRLAASPVVDPAVEDEVASKLLQCLRHGLLSEASALCGAVLPLLPDSTAEMLHSHVLSALQVCLAV